MASAEDLRRVMRRLPAGVSVITVDADGDRIGLTLATLVSLSLDPPLVGFAIRRDAALHELLRRAGAFGISLLAAGQEALAQHFARGVPPIGLWAGVDVVPDESPPLLAGAAGWLRGSILTEQPTGTHTFFVGEIESAEPGPAERALAYVAQAYVAL
ncbi:MAG: flavin reductase family protein [Actinomycetota bacterium]|nr:flavin reductase family protein [Actinomycetota bacterium]